MFGVAGRRYFPSRTITEQGPRRGCRAMPPAATRESVRARDARIDSLGPIAGYIALSAPPRRGNPSNPSAKNDNLPQTGISAQRRRASSSCAMLTWILVALRAATEPVKEEAMQAILEVCVFGVCSKNVCGNGAGSAIGGRLHPESDSFRVQPGRRSRGKGISKSWLDTNAHSRYEA